MRKKIENLGFEIHESISGGYMLIKGSFVYDDPAFEDLQEEETAIYFFNSYIEEHHLDICTLQELADFINSCDDWSLDVADIIAANEWEDETGDIYGVCNDGDYKVVINERGKAEVVDLEEESSSTDGMVAMVIKPKHYNTPYQIISGDGKTEDYFNDGINPEVKIKLIKADELTADVMVDFGFPAWFAADYYIDTDFR